MLITCEPITYIMLNGMGCITGQLVMYIINLYI